MPFDRFYFDGKLEGTLTLQDPEHHHLERVMRVALGETIELVNGKGDLAKAVVKAFSKKGAQLEVTHLDHEAAPSHLITLAIPLMRPSKLEWVLEKGTELGADAVCLYAADNSEKNDLSVNAVERLRHITIAALKQSGRLYLPSLSIVSALEEVFVHEGIFLFGDVSPEAPWIQPASHEQTTLITGPERGFSENELQRLKAKATGIKLSPHILRAETAPIAGISLLKSKALI
ncbi:MAG TPA: RsmE family RNA methyltransferase [Chlamydiales bacterium]|jgi:16S rRNA (uracil1498-N3)-methyltransferase